MTPLHRLSGPLAALLAAVLAAGCASRLPAPARLADPALQAHVQGLVCRLASRCGDIEVVLVDARSVQAELLDDGRLSVRLGLLLAIEDEAELLFVLAHELAHRELGHRPPSTFAERLPLELAADAEAVRRLSALGYPQDVGHRLIARLEAGHGSGPAGRAARDQIDQRLQALPRGDALSAAVRSPDLDRLLSRYRR